MRILRSRYLSLFLLGCTLVAAGWCAQAYLELVRLEASVVDARARVEAASRIRLELVENLLCDARIAGSADALEQVDRAAGRVREVGLLPATVGDPMAPSGFREVQGDLSTALDAVWARESEVANPSVGVAISDLKPEIRRWSVLLEQGLEELEQQLESFRVSASRFPGSVIAAIPRREGPSDAEVAGAVTTRAGISGATAGALR